MNTNPIEPSSAPFCFGDIVATVFRHKKKATLTLLAVLSLGLAVILFAPRKYSSEAKLFIQLGRETVTLDPTATTGKTISLQTNDRANEIMTVIDMLRSRGIAEIVVDQLGTDTVLGRGGNDETKEANLFTRVRDNTLTPAIDWVKSIDPITDREKAVIIIERNLKIDAEHNSTLITVRYQAKTPELAQLVTQAIVNAYREEHLRLYRTSGSKEFFEQQTTALRTQLDQSVNKLREARNRMNMVSIESRRKSLELRFNGIEETRYHTLQQLSSTQALVADIRKQIAAVPERMVSEEVTVPNSGADLLRPKLYELQVLMLKQQAKYSDDHPLLQATRKQLEKAEKKLAEVSDDRKETTQDVNPNHRTLALTLAQSESNLASLEALWSELDKQRATILAELKQLNDNELEIDQLKRESQLARTNFFRYAENLEEARIDRELDVERISNVIVAQQATLWQKPVSPSKALVIILTLAGALASVASLVFVSEMLDKRIYTEQQLEKTLQLPVFGVVPDKRKYARVLA